MGPSDTVQQANMALVAQIGPLVGTGFANPAKDLFAGDFVLHFFNAKG